MSPVNALGKAFILLYTTAIFSTATETIHIDDNNFNITYEVINGNITFELEVKANGWVSIGFDLLNGSEFADIFMGFVTIFNNQTYTLGVDCYLPTEANDTQLQIDPIQNWVVDNGSESYNGNGGEIITKLTIHRALETGDNMHDLNITNKDINLIWAYNNVSDMITDDYTKSGTVTVNLCPSCPKDGEDENGGGGASPLPIGMSLIICCFVVTSTKILLGESY